MKTGKAVRSASLVFLAIVLVPGNTISQRKSRTPRPTTTKPNPKVLSRARAAELIKLHPTFKGAYSTGLIPVGRFSYDYRTIKDLYNDNWAPLATNGILTFRDTGEHDGYFTVWYIIELTPEGETAAKSWFKASPEPLELLGYSFGRLAPAFFRIPLAERQLIEVTGIAIDPSGKRARAEFTWSWLPITQSKALSSKVPSKESHGGMLLFELYDDGWRMGQIFL